MKRTSLVGSDPREVVSFLTLSPTQISPRSLRSFDPLLILASYLFCHAPETTLSSQLLKLRLLTTLGPELKGDVEKTEVQTLSPRHADGIIQWDKIEKSKVNSD